MNRNDYIIRLERNEERREVENLVRAVICADDGGDVPIICICPELKRKGFGKILLDYPLEKAAELDCGAACFEGNIDFGTEFYRHDDAGKVWKVGGNGMKNRIIGILLITLLLLGLCACCNKDSAIPANESTFLVNFIVCDTDAFAIHFEYYLDGTPAGGGVIGNADGSKIAAEDVLTKDFIPDDFPANADLSKFQLEIFVVDQNGDEYPCDMILDFEVEYGKTYDISITGSYESGFSAKQTF